MKGRAAMRDKRLPEWALICSPEQETNQTGWTKHTKHECFIATEHTKKANRFICTKCCALLLSRCVWLFSPFAAGDKIIQIGEGGGKKYIFVVSTLRHSLQRLHPLQLAKQTTSISANLLFFHAWDCRVVTGWRVKVRSGLREARWIKGDCQLCCTRQMSGMPAMFFLPQTPFLTNLHSLPVSFLLSPSFWFMSACSCTHKSLDSEKSSCNASLRNLGCASSCLATQHRSDLNGGHKSGQLNMIT